MSDVKNTQEIETMKTDLRLDFQLQEAKLAEMRKECDRTFSNLDLFMEKCQQITKGEVDRVIQLFKSDTQRIMTLERQCKALDGISRNLEYLNSSVSQLIIS